MRLLYVFTVLLALAYFGAARRRFDLFSVAVASAIVYFLPGLWGHVLLPSAGGARVPEAVRPEVYAVFVLVVFAITASAVLFDRLDAEPPATRLPGIGTASAVLTVMAAAGLLATVATSGADLFSHQKEVVLASLGRWRVLWAVGASLGAAVAFAGRRWVCFAVCCGLLLFDLYVGFRSNLAMATIAVFLLWLGSRGRRPVVLSAAAPSAAALLAALGFFAYKYLYRAIKRGDWDLVATRLSDPGFLLRSIEHSEPFTTQAILHQAFVQDFRAPLADLSQVLYQLIVFAPELGAPTSASRPGFRVLFPDAVGGLGSNIWAEMWARGGWLLLVAFLAVFVALLGVGSHLLRSRDPMTRGGVALLGAYWAFYIHRNPLAYQLNLEKRILLLWALAAAVALVWAWLRGLGGRAAPADALAAGPVAELPAGRTR